MAVMDLMWSDITQHVSDIRPAMALLVYAGNARLAKYQVHMHAI